MSDIIEAAARAIGQANEDNNWEGVPEDYREWYRELAMCALVKVTPLIRATALEEAAKVAEEYDGRGINEDDAALTCEEIAAALRSLKEQP